MFPLAISFIFLCAYVSMYGVYMCLDIYRKGYIYEFLSLFALWSTMKPGMITMITHSLGNCCAFTTTPALIIRAQSLLKTHRKGDPS